MRREAAMKATNISKFTCSVYKFVSGKVWDTLKECGIEDCIIQRSRSVIATNKRKGLFDGDIAELEIETYHFYTAPEEEEKVYSTIINNAGLNQEGRGSIFVEPAILIEKDGIADNFDKLDLDIPDDPANFTGIYAITQRGRGNDLARTAIGNGTCVPYVFHGKGGGIRDRMGLIRITIPAEKEMLSIVVAEHNGLGMMNLLIDGGQLDRPGMGFIFTYPVKRALMDRKSSSTVKTAASIGQIVAAIDELKASTEWRKRSFVSHDMTERRYFENMENIMLICDDTQAEDLLQTAMDAGASGATISNCRDFSLKESKEGDQQSQKSQKAVEISDMVVGISQKRSIIKALLDKGFMGEGINGKIIIKKCIKAFSYTEKKK